MSELGAPAHEPCEKCHTWHYGGEECPAPLDPSCPSGTCDAGLPTQHCGGDWCPIHGTYPCICKEAKVNAFEYGQKKQTIIETVNKEEFLAANPTAALLSERETTHGSFAKNAHYGQQLRALFRASRGWDVADDRSREALDYIAGKLSRILSGKPDPQHWEDIAGYAELAAHPDVQR